MPLSPSEELVAIQEELKRRGVDLDTAINLPSAREKVGGIDYSSYANDPIGFVEQILKGTPWSKQREILESIRDYRRVSVASCHGSGKSWVAAAAAIWFLYSHPGSVVITTAPTARQVVDVIWRELRDAITANNLPGRLLTSKLEVRERWYAEGLSTDDADKFTGFHAPHILVICDEAAGISQAIYDAMRGLLTTVGARLLLIGNPTSTSGTFHASHHEQRDRWKTIQISSLDTPNFTGEEVPDEVRSQLIDQVWYGDMLADYGSEEHPLFQVRVLGKFPGQGEDTFIPLWLVMRATEKVEVVEDWYDPEFLADYEPVVAALDPARSGGAENAICIRKGPNILLQTGFRFSKEDQNQPLTMVAAGRFQALAAPFEPTIWRVDANGLGAGIADRLQELGLMVDRYNAGASPIDKSRFVLARDEDWWNFKQRLEASKVGGLISEKTKGQLTAVKYTWDSHSRIMIESKKAMKARGLPSPDHADAVVMCFKPSLILPNSPMAGGSRPEVDSYRVL
jgi:phage terminase large subunit